MGGAAYAAAPSNGWYGFIDTEYRFDRMQLGAVADNHLVQDDIVTTRFRGDLIQVIHGEFTFDEELLYHSICPPSSKTDQEWTARVPASDNREPDPAASVISMPGGGIPEPGVAGNYRLNQGGASAPYSRARADLT